MEIIRDNSENVSRKRKRSSSSTTDSEPESLKTANPYKFTHIIEKLGFYGTQRIIGNLRQLSPTYYKILNPLYINLTNKTISFHHITQDRKDDGDFAIKTLKKSTGKLDRGITSRNWDPKFAYVFQNLELGDVWFNNMKIYHDGLLFSTVISKLCSYITKITINFLPRNNDMCNPGMKLAKMIERFTELKELNLTCDSLSYFKISLDELDIMLRSLENSNVKIRMTVNRNHIVVLSKFSNLSNLKFHFEANLIDSLPELQGITSVALQYRNQIENLSLQIFLRDQILLNYHNQEEGVNRNLIELCSMCTTLDLHQSGMSTKLNVLNGCSSWPELKNLILTDYEHPLTILKCCPKLETLNLSINQNLCIFHDTLKPPDESLKEYFSNLPLLKSLTIYGRGMINQLREYLLEELLPNGVELVIYC